MGSIEEMEAALDAMEGIADDGGELTDNLAREARVRSAYLGWCKDFGKESDETRFQVFMSNFLAMEEYANESGKMMTLNKFADYTEEEYITATTAVAAPIIEEEPAAPTIQELKAAAAEEKALVVVAEDVVTSVVKEDTKAEAKAVADAEAATKKEQEIAAKAEAAARKKDEATEKASVSASNLAATNEKERKERQAAQEKAAEKLRLENEATAIAAAKAIAEIEAAQTAKRRANEAKAAELALQQAKIAEAKQAKVSSTNTFTRFTPPVPATKKAEPIKPKAIPSPTPKAGKFGT